MSLEFGVHLPIAGFDDLRHRAATVWGQESPDAIPEGGPKQDGESSCQDCRPCFRPSLLSTPVSIGHSPQSNACCVEAGIWTREDWRGRGLAPAVTKRWWECERQFKQTVFYSTTRDNRASRAVARKLGLVPVGWLWSLK